MVEMAFAGQREVMVVVHGERPPTQVRWEEFCRECRRFVWQAGRAGRTRMFVVSDGGAPGVLQRAQWLNAVERAQIRTAVVSASPAVWQIHGALQLFNAEASCFGPEELKAAMAHLGLNPRQFGDLAGLLAGLGEVVPGATTARDLAFELSEQHRRQQMKSDSGIRGAEPIRRRGSLLERWRRGA